MKTKCLSILSALLLAPLVSQADWINTDHWPWLYRDDGTWEYAYIPGFYCWNYSSEEVAAWGDPGASPANSQKG